MQTLLVICLLAQLIVPFELAYWFVQDRRRKEATRRGIPLYMVIIGWVAACLAIVSCFAGIMMALVAGNHGYVLLLAVVIAIMTLNFFVWRRVAQKIVPTSPPEKHYDDILNMRQSRRYSGMLMALAIIGCGVTISAFTTM